MKIVLINGSPKVNGSASGILLEELKCYLPEAGEAPETESAETVEAPETAQTAGGKVPENGKTVWTEIGLHTPVVSEEALRELAAAEAWVIACPLYVDGIPAHLLSCLVQLEKAQMQNRGISVYGIVNCGFYEGIQAEYALNILQNWCVKAGFAWSGGIGVGGAGGLAQMPKVKQGKGPRAPIEKALEALANIIRQRGVQEDCYVSVAFPRILYRLAAQTGWRLTIRANGGKGKDLGRRPTQK